MYMCLPYREEHQQYEPPAKGETVYGSVGGRGIMSPPGELVINAAATGLRCVMADGDDIRKSGVVYTFRLTCSTVVLSVNNDILARVFFAGVCRLCSEARSC